MAKILVTGGAGYIGSHTCVELLNAGHEVVVLDNLCNSAAESLNRVQQLTQKSLTFIQGDIRDAQLLDQVFQQHSIEAVIHFAGLKAVGESQQIPLAYFDNNIAGSISLVQAMQRAQVFKLVLVPQQRCMAKIILLRIRKICYSVCPIIIMAIPS